MLLAWVYGAIGEHDRLLQRELVRTLMRDPGDVEDGLQVIDELGVHVSASRYGECYAEAAITPLIQRAIDADALINEIVECYRTEDLVSWFAQAGFDTFFLCGVTVPHAGATLRVRYDETSGPPLYPSYVDLRRELKEPLFARFLALPLAAKHRVIELVYKPSGYTALAWKQPPLGIGPRVKAGLLRLRDRR
jgi:hypothetical protein